MAIQRNNWEPVSDLLAIDRRDIPLYDKTLMDPYNALYLIDGEWLALHDTLYTLVRAANVAAVGNPATRHSYPLWAERGRTDVRAMSGGKVPVMWGRYWEADTRVYDATLVVGGGAAITFHDQPVKVASIQPGGVGTRIYSGLVGHGGAGDTDPIVGYVSKLHTINGDKLRVKKYV